MQASSLSLELPQEPLCVDISPAGPLLATGLINGQLMFHTYTVGTESVPSSAAGGSSQAKAEGGKLQASSTCTSSSGCKVTASLAHTVDAHTSSEEDSEHSCRAVAFLPDGSALVSGSSDHSLALFDSGTAKLIRRVESAHEAGVTALLCPSPGLLASGDEDGGLKLWDLRAKKSVMHYKLHTDYISGLTLHTKDNRLLASSGDGTLSIHDFRTNRCKGRTEEDADDELLSVAVVKGGKKVVAGTQSGVINIYTWGAMRDCSDRFPGHPESVDAVLAWDEDTVITGSSDGVVRVVGILPNRLLGLVGAHSELPIERLALSQDRRVLASASHDHTVKLWDMSFLLDDDSDGDEGEGEEEDKGEEGDVGKLLRIGSTGSLRGEGEAVEVGDEGSSGASEGGSDSEEDSDGEGEEDEAGEGEEDEGEEEEEAEEQRQGTGQTAGTSGGEGAPGKGGKAARGGARPAEKPKGKQGGSDSDDDSDDDSDGPSKKRRKAEKTKWQKEHPGQVQRKHAAANFFADLL